MSTNGSEQLRNLPTEQWPRLFNIDVIIISNLAFMVRLELGRNDFAADMMIHMLKIVMWINLCLAL